MRITESCAQCLYDKQKHLTDNEEYLAEIRHLLDRRKKNDTSPYICLTKCMRSILESMPPIKT